MDHISHPKDTYNMHLGKRSHQEETKMPGLAAAYFPQGSGSVGAVGHVAFHGTASA